MGAAEAFDFVLPIRVVAVGAIAGVLRAAERLKFFLAHVDVGRRPLPDIASLF